MIPILSSSTTLTGNGLGRLSDALTCIVTHEINGIYELQMTYPVTGARYADLANDLIIFADSDNYTKDQAFRIYRITKPLNGIVTIYARHICYDMSGYVCPPISQTSLTTTLTALASSCVPSGCPFTFTSPRSVATAYKTETPMSLWQMMGGVQGSLLDVYGGEWDFNNYTATLRTTLGTNRGMQVRYGKNMTELEQDASIEAQYGGIYPFWYDAESGTLVTLPENYITVAGGGSRVLCIDFTDSFETKPTVTQLRNRATSYANANKVGEPEITWKVAFVPLQQSAEYKNIAVLESVQLGDTVSVFYEPMNLTASARAVKTDYNVLLNRFETVTLGRVKQNLAKIVVQQKQDLEHSVAVVKSTLEHAIDTATDFITNGGGYMRFIYDQDENLVEIISLDNADISQAASVWRWNNGGFGHSSTGYGGPYTTAITQNGAIVADFITAGTLDATVIRAGILADRQGKFMLNLDTGELTSSKYDSIGSRNLILGTLTPVISPAYARPHIIGQPVQTYGRPSDGTYSVQPDSHGIRYTIGSTVDQPNLYFGSPTLSTATLNGLTAGTTYTVSGWLAHKVMSNYTGSAEYTVRVRVRTDADDPGNSWSVLAEQDIRTVIPGTARTTRFSMTFTIPAAATKMYMVFYCTDTTAADYATGDYLEPRQLKLETGEVATAWSPAPEDMVGNDEIISKINISPEAITINANRISLAGKIIDLTSDTIQITSDNFSVDSDGVVTATGANISGSFTMTGGSMKIATAGDDTNSIRLRGDNVEVSIGTGGLAIAKPVDTPPFGTVLQLGANIAGSNLVEGRINLHNNNNGYSAFLYPTHFYIENNPGGVSTKYAHIGNDGSTMSVYLEDDPNESELKAAGLTVTNSTNNVALSSTTLTLTTSTKTTTFSAGLIQFTNSGTLAIYNGSSSKYSALLWPDGNGAGRVVLGDGTSTNWRTELTNDGLVFRNSSNTVTASYNAKRADNVVTKSGSAVSVASATSGMTELTNITLTTGLWMVSASLRFPSNSTGYRYALISTTSAGGTAINDWATALVSPAPGNTTRFGFVTYVNVTAASATYYLNARQNSGSTLSCNGYLSAIKVS